jgi:hypothetical protein
MTTTDMTAIAPTHLAGRVRAEFNEMPGMRLTLHQAARLWDMPVGTCECVLERLVSDGFLVRDRAQRYARRADAR